MILFIVSPPTRSKGNDFITIRPLFISGDFVNLGGKTTTKTFIHRNKIHVFHGCLKPLQKRLRIFSKQSSEKLFSSLRPQVQRFWPGGDKKNKQKKKHIHISLHLFSCFIYFRISWISFIKVNQEHKHICTCSQM